MNLNGKLSSVSFMRTIHSLGKLLDNSKEFFKVTVYYLLKAFLLEKNVIKRLMLLVDFFKEKSSQNKADLILPQIFAVDI